MNDSGAVSWDQANQAYLQRALAELKQLLRAAGRPATEPGSAAPRRREIPAEGAGPPALEIVTRAFGLSPFERDVLLLCAAAELDPEVAALCGAAHGDPARSHPTFGLAL